MRDKKCYQDILLSAETSPEGGCNSEGLRNIGEEGNITPGDVTESKEPNMHVMG